MWRIQSENGAAPNGTADEEAGVGEARDQGTSLQRSWAHGQFYERYWSQLFDIAQADMLAFAKQYRASGVARDLTSLACEVILARLRDGPQPNSEAVPNADVPHPAVRTWDAALTWRVGERAVLLVSRGGQQRAYAPRVGEVRRVGEDHVIMQVDGIKAPQVYALGAAAEIDATAEAEMAALEGRLDEVAQVDYVLWRFGGRVVGRLIQALEADARFVELDGLWFLKELAEPPAEKRIIRLAREMFRRSDGPMALDALLSLLYAPEACTVAVRFGLATALQARPDLFKNVGLPSHPRWVLVAPPPMRLVARRAVFDPQTYVVLCVPGEALSSAAAQRLWDVGLLRAALDPEDTAASTPATPEAEPDPAAVGQVAEQRIDSANASSPTSSGRSPPQPETPQVRGRIRWPRWLPFGRLRR